MSSSQRSKAFSGKQKKAQLKEKRARKAAEDGTGGADSSENNIGDDESAGDIATSVAGRSIPNKVVHRRHHRTRLPQASQQENSSSTDDISSSFGDMQLHHHHHHHRQQQQKQQQQNQLERGGQRIHHEKYNNLTSVFAKVSDETVLAMKQRAMKPIVHLDPAESLQVDMNALYHGSTNNRNAFDLPVRPPWSYSDSKEQLDTREEAYFKKWVEQVYAAASDSTEGDQLQDFSSPSSVSSLSFFEHNLEVWRQLWRVAEISDILITVLDARHPLLHIPPSLYTYITKTLGKPMVLVLNKIDLVPSRVVEAWKSYLTGEFPGVNVVGVSSLPEEAGWDYKSKNSSSATFSSFTTSKPTNKKFKRYTRAVGIANLLKTVQSVPLIKPHLGLSSSSNKDNNNSNIPSSSTSATGLVDWTAIIKRLEDSAREAEAAFLVDRRAMKQTDAAATEEGGSIGGGGRRRGRGKHLLQAKEAEDEEEYAEDYDDDDDDGDNDDDDDEQEGRDEDNLEYGAKSQKDTIPTNQQNNHSHQPLVREDIITIGMVGHPNVGKSSLINSLISRKVVSTSKTPGHTKHLQTIFLTRQIRLADCPGIVFPSFLPRPLQILSGMYKISQVREPYSSVQFLAERMNLVAALGLQKSRIQNDDDDDDEDTSWSAWQICEEFAMKKGFLTPNAGRPDVYRAANFILRLANDGFKVLLYYRPPGYEEEKRDEKGHEVKVKTAMVQARDSS